MENVSLLAAFGGGLISFISPCVLPLVPAYISFMSGVSVEDLQAEERGWQAFRAVLLSSGAFILGFSVVFVALGASATFLGQVLLEQLPLITKVAGVAVIILGLHFMGVFRISFLNMERRFHGQTTKVGLLGTFVIGLAFAFGWTPCIGPILAAILAVAATQDTVGQGMVLLSAYSLGLGVPFFLTGLATKTFLGVFTWIKRHFRTVEMVSGVFLIVVGLLITFDYFTILSGYISQLFPSLTRIG